MNREKTFQIIRTCVAMLVAVLVAFLIILAVSSNPIESIKIFLLKPFSSLRYVGNILETATPLIFSGLAMAVLFRTSLFNMGGDGVYFFAGVMGSLAAIYLKLPPVILPVLVIAIGAVSGVGVMAVPGMLRAKYGTNEMVVSLMMNSIMLGIGSFILNNIMRDTSTSALVSFKYQKAALLPKIIPGTKVHLGFAIAIIAAVLVNFILFRTSMGYKIRVSGTNSRFAEYSGINVSSIILKVHLLAGILCGLGGIIECLGLHKRFEWTALPGYGFDGCMIAMLAGNNPYGVIGSALFVGYLRVGTDLVNRFSDVPTEMIAILQSIIILLISAERFLYHYKQKWIEKAAHLENTDVQSAGGKAV